VDYLKYDNCNNDGTSSRIRYPPMRDALNATGRPIFFSMCQWGQESPWVWAKPVGNSWRTTGDIDGTYKSFVSILDKQVGLSRYAGPGGWNDPDMLEVGNGQMTNDEYQTHFAFWAALKAPLLIGCTLTGISKATLDILGNEEVIAVNQDASGIQADLMVH
jgi:alpha-galactosidase